jgi:hypothetical protein
VNYELLDARTQLESSIIVLFANNNRKIPGNLLSRVIDGAYDGTIIDEIQDP